MKCTECKETIKNQKIAWFETKPFHSRCLSRYKQELKDKEICKKNKKKGKNSWLNKIYIKYKKE